MSENVFEVKVKPGEEITITLRNPLRAASTNEAPTGSSGDGAPTGEQLHAIGTEALKTARTVLDAVIELLADMPSESTTRTKRRVKVE